MFERSLVIINQTKKAKLYIIKNSNCKRLSDIHWFKVIFVIKFKKWKDLVVIGHDAVGSCKSVDGTYSSIHIKNISYYFTLLNIAKKWQLEKYV